MLIGKHERWDVFGFIATICLFLVIVPDTSAQDEMTIVVVEEGQTLRQIAQEYLQDPNLWIDILRQNNLSSATDIHPGMQLQLPASAVARANEELQRSLELFEEATRNGARLFAPSIIAQSMNMRDRAQAAKNSGDWTGCLENARESSELARQALDICLENQNVPAQAVVNYREGSVEARNPESRSWSNAPMHHVLLEGDRVRTLSNSFAGIMFRDESRLRLEENSLALIQKMRYNMLENSEESSITLLEGDLFALLGGGRQGENFQLDVGGEMDTEVNSTAFYVSRDEESTRFANYDGEISLTSGDETVVLAENMGSVIRRGQAPGVARELLPKPNLISPGTFTRVYSNQIEFQWEPVDGAVRYWIEIAHDKMFNRLVHSDRNVREPNFTLGNAVRELYYWRVAAIDEYGLPGPKSEVRLAAVIDDVFPPYLLVITPHPNEIVDQQEIVIRGETEQDATLYFQGREVGVHPSGGFEIPVTLEQGHNLFLFEAHDVANNVNSVELEVTYVPQSLVSQVRFDSSMTQIAPNHFTTPNNGFNLVGSTQQYNRVSLESNQSRLRASALVGEDGDFQLSLPLIEQREDFILTERSPTGSETHDEFVVEVDARVPVIEFDDPLPTVVGERELTVSGRVIDGHRLEFMDAPVELTDEGRFTLTIPLETGENQVHFDAFDQHNHVTISRHTIHFDESPPRFERVSFSSTAVSGGETVLISVRANDSSTMARAAQYSIQVGEFRYTGYLILNRDNELYQGRVSIPEDTRGTIQMTRLILADHYGNQQEISF